ncbi:vacuolar membrane-associated protein iml1 [Allomyces javanicus]|nr:vacuolar membrane-associated protein iml1 [Allomyces javanicus]
MPSRAAAAAAAAANAAAAAATAADRARADPGRLCNLWVHSPGSDDRFKADLILSDALVTVLGAGSLVQIEPANANATASPALLALLQDPPIGAAATWHAPAAVRDEAMAAHRLGAPDTALVMKVPDADPAAKGSQLQVSVASHLAALFNLQARTDVKITAIDPAAVAAEYIEVAVKDQYLSRSDMWHIKHALVGQCVYVAQKLAFPGGLKCQVREVFRRGTTKAACGLVTHDTKTIFRSESARIYLLVHIAKEMHDRADDGDLYFERAVDGFLPDLFARWKLLATNHLVTIVFFTRVLYDTREDAQCEHVPPRPASASPGHAGIGSPSFGTPVGLGIHAPPEPVRAAGPSSPLGTASTATGLDGQSVLYKDFYKVMVDMETRTDWSTVLLTLKREFLPFVRSVLQVYDAEGVPVVRGRLAPAHQGNVLEAVNLALNPHDKHYIDRDVDFVRTGLSILVVTPTPGFLEVDKTLLRLTTQRMLDNGVGLDLVCLTRPPLHAAPLFVYASKFPYAEKQPPPPPPPTASATPSVAGKRDKTDYFYAPPKFPFPDKPTAPPPIPPLPLHGPSASTSKRDKHGSGSSKQETSLASASWDPLYYDDDHEDNPELAFFTVPDWIDCSYYYTDDPLAFTPRARMPALQWNTVPPTAAETAEPRVPPMPSAAGLDWNKFDEGLFAPTTAAAAVGEGRAGSSSPPPQGTGTPGAGASRAPSARIAASPVPSAQSLIDIISATPAAARPDVTRPLALGLPAPPEAAAASDGAAPDRRRNAPTGPVPLALDKPPRPGPWPSALAITTAPMYATAHGGDEMPASAHTTTSAPPGIAISPTDGGGGSAPAAYPASLMATSVPVAMPARATSDMLRPVHHRYLSTSPRTANLLGSSRRTTESMLRHVVASARESLDSNGGAPSVVSAHMHHHLETIPDDNSDAGSPPVMAAAPVLYGRRHTAGTVGSPPRDGIYGGGALGRGPPPPPAQARFPHGTPTSTMAAGAFYPAFHSADHGFLRPNLINPWHPYRNVIKLSAHLQRWHHIYPRAANLHIAAPKWTSLCTPALLPVTTDSFPSDEERRELYQEYTYSVSPFNTDPNAAADAAAAFAMTLPNAAGLMMGMVAGAASNPQAVAARALLAEMVALRMTQGFQVVTPDAVAAGAAVPAVAGGAGGPGGGAAGVGGTGPVVVAAACGSPSASVAAVAASASSSTAVVASAAGAGSLDTFLSMGHHVHKLSVVADANVEVKRYVRKLEYATRKTTYRYHLWSRDSAAYHARRAAFDYPQLAMFKWNYVDHLLSGSDDDDDDQGAAADAVHFMYRVRFVLIPMDAAPALGSGNEAKLDDEENRLALFQKFLETVVHKYVADPNAVKVQFTSLTRSAHVRHEMMLQQMAPPTASTGGVTDEEAPPTPSAPSFSPLMSLRRGSLAPAAAAAAAAAAAPPVPTASPPVSATEAALAVATAAGPITLDRMKAIVTAMQGSIKIGTRRWHLTVYEKVFLGSDLVEWMVKHMEDVKSRDEAVAIGNELVKAGLVAHALNRHAFLDGFYYYRLRADLYVKEEPRAAAAVPAAAQEPRTPFGAWFRTAKNSVPDEPAQTTLPDAVSASEPQTRTGSMHTPPDQGTGALLAAAAAAVATTGAPAPLVGPRHGADVSLGSSVTPVHGSRMPSATGQSPHHPHHHAAYFHRTIQQQQQQQNQSQASFLPPPMPSLQRVAPAPLTTPTKAAIVSPTGPPPVVRPFELSRKVAINLDKDHKCDRKQGAVMHMDTTHHARHCYSVQIHWLNSTTWLLAELFREWARQAERSALKMVQAPIDQVKLASDEAAFHTHTVVQLAVPPPPIADADVASVVPLFYETALVKMFGFVLDLEADSKFPKGAVSLSCARRPIEYSQFIHRSGTVYVLVRPAAMGLLWIPNPVYQTTAAPSTRSSNSASNAAPTGAAAAAAAAGGQSYIPSHAQQHMLSSSVTAAPAATSATASATHSPSTPPLLTPKECDRTAACNVDQLRHSFLHYCRDADFLTTVWQNLSDSLRAGPAAAGIAEELVDAPGLVNVRVPSQPHTPAPRWSAAAAAAGMSVGASPLQSRSSSLSRVATPALEPPSPGFPAGYYGMTSATAGGGGGSPQATPPLPQAQQVGGPPVSRSGTVGPGMPGEE